MKLLVISKEVEAMKPVWSDFIRKLGYPKKQAEAFAEGYAAAVAKLPTLEKLQALAYQDDRCMTAGFLAAAIDESEALARAKGGTRKASRRPRRRAARC